MLPSEISVTVDLTKNPKIASKFDVKGAWNKPSSIDECITQAGDAETLLNFITSKAEATIKARGNSVWRNLADDDKTTETPDTIATRIQAAFQTNPFVSERGNLAQVREDAKRLADVRAMKAKVASGEISIDELLAAL